MRTETNGVCRLLLYTNTNNVDVKVKPVFGGLGGRVVCVSPSPGTWHIILGTWSTAFFILILG